MYYTIPDVDPRLVGWIVNYSRRNFWKVKDFMELEDLVHEGFDCIYIAKVKYADRLIENPKKWTNTVKLMVANNIPYLRTCNIRMPEGSLIRIGDMIDPERELAFSEMLVGSDENEGIRQVVAEAPPRIKPILESFLDVSSPLHAFLKRRRRYRMSGIHETLNERLCRYLGIDPEQYNVCQEIREYLSA